MTDFRSARQKMVDGQIRPSDVTDLRIIDAMMAVPREAFVPDHLKPLAYLDLDLEVTATPAKRYLLKPAVIAKMVQAAEIAAGDRVLVVGCATGYTAALVAKLAAQVVATEADPALVAAGNAALTSLGIDNVTLVTAPAPAGAPSQAPYDAIILDGATQIAPQELYRQLAEGGRLVGVFATTQPPRVEIVTRSPGDFGNRPVFDAYAPTLPGLERPASFTF